MRDALSANPDLDGVFCTNDDIAMGALLLCRERTSPCQNKFPLRVFMGWRLAGK